LNLDNSGVSERADLLAPPEWTMDVHQDGNMYTAEVKRSQVTMCRLSIATGVGDEKVARTALAHKARLWIREYLKRPPRQA
jgi:hypothetical protein